MEERNGGVGRSGLARGSGREGRRWPGGVQSGADGRLLRIIAMLSLVGERGLVAGRLWGRGAVVETYWRVEIGRWTAHSASAGLPRLRDVSGQAWIRATGRWLLLGVAASSCGISGDVLAWERVV
jgi:hypothetical protein